MLFDSNVVIGINEVESEQINLRIGRTIINEDQSGFDYLIIASTKKFSVLISRKAINLLKDDLKITITTRNKADEYFYNIICILLF